MTTVIADKGLDGKIMVAADRRIVDADNTKYKSPKSKLHKRNGVLLATAGDWTLGAKILYTMPFTPYSNKYSPSYYVFEIFCEDLLSYLRKKGQVIGKTDRLYTDDADTSILLIIKNKIFEIAISHENGVAASQSVLPCGLGSGRDFARGALMAIKEMLKQINCPYDVKVALKCAVSIAAKVDIGTNKLIDIKVAD